MLVASILAGGSIRADSVETAVLAGGCFWCMEADFSQVRGVLKVTFGYTGGSVPNPTYEEVSSGETGHVEAIEVQFDPALVSYRRILDLFWSNIDPFDDHGQFCDKGSQYHSVIFYRDEEQKREALESKAAVEKRLNAPKPIATLIREATTFYPAEEYHQEFHKKNPLRYNSYKAFCGRTERLREIWGDKQASEHGFGSISAVGKKNVG